jgi:hypothetical protein
MVLTGEACVPALLSLDVEAADTKMPNCSLMMHGSVVTDGKSELGKHAAAHVW